MNSNQEQEYVEIEPVYSTAQMVLFGIIAASLLYLIYKGGQQLFSAVVGGASPESKKIIYNSAITVSEIASRLHY